MSRSEIVYLLRHGSPRISFTIFNSSSLYARDLQHINLDGSRTEFLRCEECNAILQKPGQSWTTLRRHFQKHQNEKGRKSNSEVLSENFESGDCDDESVNSDLVESSDKFDVDNSENEIVENEDESSAIESEPSDDNSDDQKFVLKEFAKPYLKVLINSKANVRKSLIKTAPRSILKLVANAAKEAAYGDLHLCGDEKNNFRRHKKYFQVLTNKNKSWRNKRKFLSHHGRYEFLPSLLRPVMDQCGDSFYKIQ